MSLSVDRSVDRTAAPETADERLHAAAIRCLSRWGVTKTTLDDVAREAGLSRATAYRIYPGGKDALLQAVLAAELHAFYAAMDEATAGATTLEDLVVSAMTEAGRQLTSHPVLTFVLAFEPEVLLPHVSFAGMEHVLAAATEWGVPRLERFVSPAAARVAAEWITRITLSYVGAPTDAVALGDEASVRRLVRTFVLPAISTRG